MRRASEQARRVDEGYVNEGKSMETDKDTVGRIQAKAIFVEEELAVRMFISRNMLHHYIQGDSASGVMITHVMRALTKDYETVVVPADWWQAFKGRWFPRWWTNRHPVKNDIYKFARYCPHLNTTDGTVHARWLQEADKGPRVFAEGQPFVWPSESPGEVGRDT